MTSSYGEKIINENKSHHAKNAFKIGSQCRFNSTNVQYSTIRKTFFPPIASDGKNLKSTH